MKKYIGFMSNKWFLLGAGVVLGALIVLGVRFATYETESVHYHANFAVYVNGHREMFSSPDYYEETAIMSCTAEHAEDPLERAHMHDNVNSVVHVEDHMVTWGHFFQNLGWGLGDDYLKTIDGVYTPGGQGQLTFILNGKRLESVANIIVGDLDKLLVSYGDSAQAMSQYKMIQDKALEENQKTDPAGCSGNVKPSLSDRMKHLL